MIRPAEQCQLVFPSENVDQHHRKELREIDALFAIALRRGALQQRIQMCFGGCFACVQLQPRRPRESVD